MCNVAPLPYAVAGIDWTVPAREESGDVIGEHIAHCRRRSLAAGTIYKRRRILATIDDALGLSTVTAEQLEQFLDDRGVSAKTRYDWVSQLHQFFKWAVDFGYLDHDPTVRVVRPRLKSGLPRPIGNGDLTLALQMADPMMRAWLTLAAFAGLRCAEIASLSVDRVRWDDRVLLVAGKGDKERVVPMHAEVVRVLRSMPLPARGRLFRRPRGGAYPAAQVSREVSLYLHDLGITATAHQLRHWFGTHIYRQCRDLRVTQELMGHSSPTTTAVYADWSRAEAERAVAGLEVGDLSPSVLSDWAS